MHGQHENRDVGTVAAEPPHGRQPSQTADAHREIDNDGLGPGEPTKTKRLGEAGICLTLRPPAS
jgi:hypothetical protein